MSTKYTTYKHAREQLLTVFNNLIPQLIKDATAEGGTGKREFEDVYYTLALALDSLDNAGDVIQVFDPKYKTYINPPRRPTNNGGIKW